MNANIHTIIHHSKKVEQAFQLINENKLDVVK